MGPVTDELSALVVAQLLFLESEGATKPVSVCARAPAAPPRPCRTVH